MVRRKEQRISMVSKQQNDPKDIDTNPSRQRSSRTSQATESVSLSDKRLSLAKEEPKVGLAGDNRTRSSGTGRHFASTVDVDDFESQIQHSSPSLFSRNVSNASRASRASLLVGAGAQEYLQLRDLQSSEKDQKNGRHQRFSVFSAMPSTSTNATNSNASTHPTSSTPRAAHVDESQPERRRKSSGARRNLEEFEQKRQSLPTSTMVAATMVLSPAIKQDQSSWEQVTAVAAAGSPAKLGSLKNRRNPPPKPPDLTSTDSTMPHSTTTRSTYFPVTSVQQRFMPPEQLIVATLVENDDSSNRSDSGKGNASLTSLDLDLGNDLPETAPLPLDNNYVMPRQLEIAQAKPATASDSFWDLWRNRNGKILIGTLLLFVVAMADGVAVAVGGFDKKYQNTNQNEPDKMLLPRNTSTGTPESSVPTESPTDEVEPVAPTFAPTMAPKTLAPTSDLQGYLESFLPNYSLAMLQDATSSQSRALKWLLYDHDPADLLNYTSSRIRQRFAMATFFYATEGVGWRQSRNWLSTDKDVNECDWWSHYDNVPGIERASPCNKFSELELLALNENYLRGTLPKEVAMLSNLTEISLVADAFFASTSDEDKKSKFISGSIPVEWMTSLTNLKILDLSRNAISGAIGSEIAMLHKLERLSLVENLLSSTIPPELFSLSGVTEVWLYDNRITGTLPSGFQFVDVKLRTFAAGHNQLSGSLPTEYGALSQLLYLKLESNQFSGTIM
jgi:hypothetical protein